MDFGGGGDKWADRSWDWAKDMSRKTEGGWNDIYTKSLGTASGQQSPWAQSTYSNAQGLLNPYLSGSQDQTQNPLYQQIAANYQPWANDVDPYTTDLYKGAEGLYSPDAYMNQMYEPMKRGIEGQYQQSMDQMLQSGVKGGSLTDMLSGIGSDRMTSLSDMERGLRTQDLARGDNRAQTLMQLANSIYQQQQSGRLSRASGLQQALMQLGSQDEQEQMTARMYLANLMNVLNETDVSRARSMADVGVQGRYLTGNQLAQSGTSQDTSLMGSLLGMGTMMGMGMGQKGTTSAGGGMTSGGSYFGNLGSGMGSMFFNGAEGIS
jgi:hypothetical protein